MIRLLGFDSQIFLRFDPIDFVSRKRSFSLPYSVTENPQLIRILCGQSNRFLVIT